MSNWNCNCEIFLYQYKNTYCNSRVLFLLYVINVQWRGFIPALEGAPTSSLLGQQWRRPRRMSLARADCPWEVFCICEQCRPRTSSLESNLAGTLNIKNHYNTYLKTLYNLTLMVLAFVRCKKRKTRILRLTCFVRAL